MLVGKEFPVNVLRPPYDAVACVYLQIYTMGRWMDRRTDRQTDG